MLTALEKLPADRFASAAQFAEALGNRSYASTTVTAALAAAAPGAQAQRRRGALVYALTGALVLAAAAAAWGWLRPGPAPVVNRYSLFLRSSEALQASVNGSINVAISPDGKRVAYVGPGESGGRIWLREHDKLRPVPINGTEGGTSPFFSPDGRSLGFLVGGRTVRVISLGGGPAITLSDSVNSSGGDWGADGYVYIEVDSGIARIRATGGPQEPVYRMGPGRRRRSAPSSPTCSPAARP